MARLSTRDAKARTGVAIDVLGRRLANLTKQLEAYQARLNDAQEALAVAKQAWAKVSQEKTATEVAINDLKFLRGDDA